MRSTRFQVKRSTEPHQVAWLSSRKSSRSSRSPAPRLTASCSKPMSRKSRPANSSFRPVSRRSKASFSGSRSTSATSAARARNCAPAVNYSQLFQDRVELGFTEPYLFDKNIALGGDIFRRDYNSFNFVNGDSDRNTTYQQVTTGVPAPRWCAAHRILVLRCALRPEL